MLGSGCTSPDWDVLCCPAEFLAWHTWLLLCLHSTSDHVCERMRFPHLSGGDRAGGGREGVPRTLHTPLPFPTCLSSRACVALTTKPGLPGSQLNRYGKSLWWIPICWQLYNSLGGSFTPPVGAATSEKNPCLVSPASLTEACGWWGLT